MSESGTKPSAVLGSLRRMGDSLLGLVQTRVQLFALELQGETLRRLDLLLWLGVALAVGAMGMMVGTAALAIYLWRTAGYAGLMLAAGVLVGLSALWVWRLREGLRKDPPPFANTVAEFEKDRACLQTKS